ncbi:aldehyde dehydrogenase family protein [Arundinibacter roseus]|uniref:Aldehyde dehydrogenase n=1 Tax=Arundinibacter roseus TaxID=2070510 RepID=A0A4R4KG70_9BACT|nr:aldehyde dehydrogenase family protein [Arundinibacter roseus]TDB67047.1 aldehyde dehydrogenase family protein [Arundinibacter roseus]
MLATHTSEITTTTIQAVKKVFLLQQQATQRLKTASAAERIGQLKKLRTYLLSHMEEAKDATYKDFRKPEAETMLGEMFGVLGELNYTIKNLKRWMKPKQVSTPLSAIGTDSYIQYEAKGNALIISPWNYPISLALKPLVSALAAGCTVIIKPSELTPHSSAFIKKVIEDTFSPSEVAVFEGDATLSQALLELPFNHIFFTGSPAIGKVVMKAAAQHLASVTLELGGKSPCIIDETVQMADTARKVAWAKFLNNGQTCIAPDYVLVHRSVKDSFVKEFGKAIQEMYFSNGTTAETSESYCRIVNEKHFQRLDNYLHDAVGKGAKLEVGGKTTAQENFIEPTLISHVTDEMLLMQEEIFGPLLPLRTYETLDEVIDYINQGEKPLALYINSRNAKTVETLLNSTTAGDALVNEFLLQFGNHEIPFGGVNNSGIGKSNGFFGFEEFSNRKGVMKRRFGTMKFLYPPYSERINKLLNWAVKYV